MISDHPRYGGPPLASEFSEDADVVRAFYRALEEGDDVVLEGCAHPRIEYIDPLVARLPFDGRRRGLPSVVRSAFRRNDGTGPRISAETFLELGDGVLVVGRLLQGRGVKETGEPFLHECSVRSGKVVWIREYQARTRSG